MPIISGAATGSNADRVNVWIEWWESTIDYANNRSYVYAVFYAQTKATASSNTYDNNGNSNFYVNGVRASGIVNGTIDFRSPARPLNVLGTWEGWVGRDGNGNANIGFSGDFSLSSSFISGGSASGIVSLTTIWTSASAPTNPNLSPGTYENSITFQWGAALPGVNNAILKYLIFYRWNYGNEHVVDVGNTTLWTLDTSIWARGTILDFRVTAVTQRGEYLGSGFSAAARKNRVPNQLTSPSVPKTSYIPGEIIRVSFANTGDPDGNLAGCEVATDQNETIVGTRAGAAITYVDVDTTGWPQGIQRRFRVRGYDTFGVRGLSWSIYTAQVTLNTAPNTPEINYPVAGATVYNRRPHVLLKAGATNDGPKHILCVNDGSEKTTAANGAVFSSGTNDNLSSAQQVVYLPPSDLQTGSNTLTSRMFDSFLYSSVVSRAFSVAAFAPEDPDLSLPGMVIKAVYITALQVAIGHLRSAYGLSAVAWTPCIAGTTGIGSAGSLISELQTALQGVIDRINSWDASNTVFDISVVWVNPAAQGGGIDRVKLRQAIEQLRAIILQI